METWTTKEILEQFWLSEAADDSVSGTQANTELALAAKGRLIEDMSYHIRTLSNAIIGFCELLSQEHLSEIQKEYVAEINVSGRGLALLISDVLDMTKLEAGRLAINPAKASLGRLLHEINSQIGPAALNKGLEFKIILSNSLPENIITDNGRLRQCLIKLLGNAVKYTDSGFVHLTVSADQVNGLDFIRFDVADSGVGISPERYKDIFQPYMQVHRANDKILFRLDQGLSISGGLALVNSLAKLFNGAISLTSDVGYGSIFTLVVPAGLDIKAEPALEFDSNQTSAIQNHADNACKKCAGHILLVEDEPSNRTVIGLLLETMGLQVTTAENGMEAVEKVHNDGTFDIILMDIKMPKMNGCDAAKKIRSNGIKTPIIALSAAVLADDKDRTIIEVFDSLLDKPVDSRKLYDKISAYLPSMRSLDSMLRCQLNSLDADYENYVIRLNDTDDPIWTLGINHDAGAE